MKLWITEYSSLQKRSRNCVYDDFFYLGCTDTHDHMIYQVDANLFVKANKGFEELGIAW